MKVKTQLSLTQTTRGDISEQAAREHGRGQKLRRPSWKGGPTRAEKQRTIKPALHAASRCSEQRAARVEALRAQVKAGTYQVDSRVLAERMLVGLSHDDGNDRCNVERIE